METTDKRRPYVRALIVGAVFLALVSLRVAFDETGRWNLKSPRGFAILAGASLIAALILGVIAARVSALRSWSGMAIGTVVSWFVAAGLMLLSAQVIYLPRQVADFETTSEMMANFANQAREWVKKDRGIDLDYSEDSVRIVEEELGRIYETVDKANPQPGTRGIAMGYGAYIGEVIRRQHGGGWEKDHPVAGAVSFPFSWSSTNTVFPIGWCWNRLVNGDEDNVYFKFMALASTNSSTSETIRFHSPELEPQTEQ